MKKRLISILLVLCMVLTCMPANALAASVSSSAGTTTSQTVSDLPFTDVRSGDWYYKAVRYALANGFFNGTTATTFDPDGTLTRGMFVTVLGRMAGVDMSAYQGNTGFSDVKTSSYCAPYVKWAAKHGITSGAGNRLFLPDAPVTREQMAAFLVRYFENFKVSYETGANVTTEPADIEQTAAYARDAVRKLWKQGLLNGDGVSFAPASNATRAQTAAICMRTDKTVDKWYREPGVKSDRVSVDPDAVQQPADNKPADSNKNNSGSSSGSSRPGQTKYYEVSFALGSGQAEITLPEKQSVAEGTQISALPTPYGKGKIFLGWYYDAAMTRSAAAGDKITANMTLYAGVAAGEDVTPIETPNYVTQTDVEAGTYTFSLSGVNNAEGTFTFVNITDANAAVQCTVSGKTVSAILEAGQTYQVELTDDNARLVLANGSEQPETVRYLNILTAKAETKNAELNPNVKQISKADVENLPKDVFDGIYQVDSNGVSTQNATNGSFTYNGSEKLSVGDTVAVVDGANLNDITDTNGEAAYLKITAVNGSNYTYEMADVEDVLFMPDVLPIEQGWDTDGDSANHSLTVSVTNIAAAMNNVSAESLDKGDFIVFIKGAYSKDSKDSNVLSYGEITSVSQSGDNYVIAYSDAAESDIDSALDVYYSKDEKIELSSDEQKRIEDEVKADVKDSGYVEQAAAYLASVMLESDNLENIPDMDQVTVRMNSIDTYALSRGVAVQSGNKKVDVDFDKNNINVVVRGNSALNHLQGSGFNVTVNIPFTVTINDTVEISITAKFEEELILRQNVSTKRHKIGFLRYDYSLNAAFEVGNYTGIGFTADIVAAGDDDDEKSMIEKLDAIMDRIENYKDTDGITADGTMESLSEIYQSVMENANDTWIELVNVKLFENNGNAFLHIFCWQVKGSFIVSANLAVSMGMSFDYTTQKRYNFSVRVKSKNTTNQTIDVITPQYNFDFYVVGTVGIRAGVRLEMYVGLFSLKLDKIGITADAGAYAKLWGYFFYHLKWIQSSGKESNSAGAMMIEIGAYLEIHFIAQAFSSSKLTWAPTIYENEWPLWSVGEQQNVYAFYNPDENYEYQTVRTLALPSSTYDMSYMDLKSGEISVTNRDDSTESNFVIAFSNPAFSYDPATNTIKVSPPDNSFAEETDMTVTWKKAALAFTSKPVQKTIHIKWTDPDGARYIAFDSQGGSAVKQITARESTAITWPDDPTKQGYVFGGWYKDTNCTQKADTLTTMPTFSGDTKGMTLYAKWTPATDTHYTVEYYLENLNGTYSLDTTDDSCTGTTGSETQASVPDHTGFTAQPVEEQTIAPDSSTVVKVYYQRNTYTVTFKLYDGADDIIQTYKYDAELAQPMVSREGYTFINWNAELSKTVTADATYTAQWTGNENTISFVSNGSTINTKTVRTGDKITELPADLEKTGYTFGGWYTDQNCTNVWDFNNPITGAMTLYAKWTANTYNVTLDPNYTGSTEPVVQPVTYDSTYGDLPTPERAGYNFLGWFTETSGGTQVTAEDKVSITADQTLYAHWKEGEAEYTVKHLQQNVENDEYTVFESETLTGTTGQPTAAQAKDYTGFTVRNLTQATIAADGSTVIEIKYDRLTYTITWKNGEDTLETDNTVRYGAKPSYDGTTPEKTAVGHTYTFTGWEPELTAVTGNATYTAKFKDTLNTYGITYKLNGGTNASGNPDSYTYDTAVMLQNPTRTGYTFDGWFVNADFTGNAVTEIPADETGEKTFYAKWTANTYTVTFDMNYDGTTSTTQQVTFNGKYVLPSRPTRSGYKFLGWFTEATGGDKVTEDVTVSTAQDHTLYAHWDQDNTVYNLYLGGTQVRGSNADDILGDGTAYFDGETNTLTLNNCKLTHKGYTKETGSGNFNGVIYYNGYYDDKKTLHIVLKGTNTLTNTSTTGNHNAGIMIQDGDLVIEGDGTLNTRGGAESTSYNSTSQCYETYSYGIYVYGNLTINSGTINASAVDKITSEKSYSITVIGSGIEVKNGNVTINGGTVTAKGCEIDINSASIFGSTAAYGSSSGIHVSHNNSADTAQLFITGGTVTASGATSVSASGGTPQAKNYGVYAEKLVSVTGGSLTATSGTARKTINGSTSNDTSSGIATSSFTMSGGSVLATSEMTAFAPTALNIELTLSNVTAQLSNFSDGDEPYDYIAYKAKSCKWFKAA